MSSPTDRPWKRVKTDDDHDAPDQRSSKNCLATFITPLMMFDDNEAQARKLLSFLLVDRRSHPCDPLCPQTAMNALMFLQKFPRLANERIGPEKLTPLMLLVQRHAPWNVIEEVFCLEPDAYCPDILSVLGEQGAWEAFQNDALPSKE